MGLFSSPKKVKDPFKKQKTNAVNYLNDLLSSGTPDLPTQNIVGMTGVQSDLLASLGDYSQDFNANYGKATGYYNDVLKGDYDPRTSDFYKGLRAEASQLKADTGTAIKRNATSGGMMTASPTSGLIGASDRQINNQQLQQLGAMYENERGRMGQAAQGLQMADSQRLSNTAQVMQLSDVERQIAQQRDDALYSQALNTVMFPYQYQAGIAASIFSSSQPVVTGGGLTTAGSIATMGTSLLGAYFAGGGGAGGAAAKTAAGPGFWSSVGTGIGAGATAIGTGIGAVGSGIGAGAAAVGGAVAGGASAIGSGAAALLALL